MKIVIDTNVLLAAVLKDNVVRRVLRSQQIHFLIPEHAFEEVEKHVKELADKASLTVEEVEEILMILLENIEIIPKESIMNCMKEALEIMKEIDIDDAPFIATALATASDGVWSYDDDLKRQDIVRVFSIQEMIKFAKYH